MTGLRGWLDVIGGVVFSGFFANMTTKIELTRAHLVKDDDRDWASRYKGMSDIASPAERAGALRNAIDAIQDWDAVWAFAYGSLMWNPAFHFDNQTVGKIYGLHRAFCLRSHIGRGTPQQPGLMLGLDRGGSCRGLAYHISRGSVEGELDLLFKREMLTRIYKPTWVTVHTPEHQLRALTFVVDRDNDRYTRNLPESEQLEMFAKASGQLGPCHEYLFDTVHHLEELGIVDRSLCRLATKVRDYMR